MLGGFGEYAVLDRFHFRVKRFKYRHVIVDDEIEDGVENVIFPLGEDSGAGLAALADDGVGARSAVADRHHVAAPDE